MKLLFIRHGRTHWNNAGRMQGQLVAPDLIPGEFARAQTVARKQLIPQGITHIYSSDLIRTRQTAEAISSVLGLPFRFDRRLRETNQGIFQGKTNADVVAFDPDFYEKRKHIHFRYPDGESVFDLYHRWMSFVQHLRETHDENDVILLVSHGSYSRIFQIFMSGAPLSEVYDQYHPYNLEILEGDL